MAKVPTSLRSGLCAAMFMGLMGLIGFIAAGCAGPQSGLAGMNPAEKAELQTAQAEVKTLRAEMARLAAQLTAMSERLAAAEQRTGLRPVAGRWLKPLAAGTRFLAGAATVIDGPDDRGKQRNLAKYTRSTKGYVVALWATWCKPCTSREELALLHKLQPQLRQRGVELVSILVDDLDQARGHALAQRWIYPLWFVKSAHTQWLPEALIRQGLSLPVFLVVSPEGEARYWAAGKLDEAAVRDLVAAAGY